MLKHTLNSNLKDTIAVQMDDEMDNQNRQQQSRVNQQITATSFAAKYKSKREVYNFLTIDVKAYLPSYDTISIYFLKDLVSGQKKSKYFIYFQLIPYFQQSLNPT